MPRRSSQGLTSTALTLRAADRFCSLLTLSHSSCTSLENDVRELDPIDVGAQPFVPSVSNDDTDERGAPALPAFSKDEPKPPVEVDAACDAVEEE